MTSCEVYVIEKGGLTARLAGAAGSTGVLRLWGEPIGDRRVTASPDCQLVALGSRSASLEVLRDDQEAFDRALAGAVAMADGDPESLADDLEDWCRGIVQDWAEHDEWEVRTGQRDDSPCLDAPWWEVSL